MTADTTQALLEARDLSFGYQRGHPILEHWSAEFHPGTTTALTGPSGRGKSTLLYLLGLMLRPDSGEVLIEGEPCTRLPDAERARLRATRFGFVFQDAALDLTRTVLDNVTETSLYRPEPRWALRERALELLEQFGVDLAAERKPGQVSGGQAQRIALCRALLATPDILLADEPTGNLDPDSAEVVLNAMQAHAAQGAAVIIVTHSRDIAEQCDIEVTL